MYIILFQYSVISNLSQLQNPKKSNTYDDILYIKWVQIFCDFEPTLDEKSKGLP